MLGPDDRLVRAVWLLLADGTAIVGSELLDIALLRLGVLALQWQDDSVQKTEATDSTAPRDTRR